MLKLVVAIVLVAALLSGASPWTPIGMELHTPALFEGFFGIIGAIIALAIAIGVIGWVFVAVVGSLLLAVVGIPILLVLAVVALVFAPILLPLILVLMVVGILIKGAVFAVAC